MTPIRPEGREFTVVTVILGCILAGKFFQPNHFTNLIAGDE